MLTKDWPTKSYEKRVPRVCVPFLLRQGYSKIPVRDKLAWLEARFYLPAGWPECKELARVIKLSRMRKHCWNAVYPYVTRDAGERCVGPGRPVTRQLREAALYRLLHTTQEVPEEWRWPLINLATYEKLLPLEERLWIVVRPSVLPIVAVRGLSLAVATFATGVSEVPASLLQRATRLLEQKIVFERSTADTWYELRHILRECRDSLAVETLTSVAEANPNYALRRVLANASRLLLTHGVSHHAMLERFHHILANYVSNEMM